MLHKETAQTIGNWIFQDILCHWGTLVKIVSDNGKPFIAALGHLEKKYHIKHIWISGYNSCANGIAEHSHFDVRQALFKASDGEEHKWSQVTQSVFWSERMTPCKHMGCSPYFAITGTHPLLPFDIIEANYLLPPPDSLISTTEQTSFSRWFYRPPWLEPPHVLGHEEQKTLKEQAECHWAYVLELECHLDHDVECHDHTAPIIPGHISKRCYKCHHIRHIRLNCPFKLHKSRFCPLPTHK